VEQPLRYIAAIIIAALENTLAGIPCARDFLPALVWYMTLPLFIPTTRKHRARPPEKCPFQTDGYVAHRGWQCQASIGECNRRMNLM
jgi:hypothetical protein